MKRKLIIFFKKFKNVSLVDYLSLSVFFIIVLVAALFFLRKAVYVNVTLKISSHDDLTNPWLIRGAPVRETPEWYLENISKGLEERDLLNRISSKVNRVNYYPRLSGAEIVYVDLSLRVTQNKSTGEFAYKGSPISVGSFQEILISNLRIPGIITSVGVDGEDVNYQEKDILIKGFLKTQDNEWISYPAETEYDGIEKYLSDKIEKGMTYRDSEGNFVAEIIEVEKFLAKRIFVSNGYLAEAIDHERERVELIMKLRVREKNNVIYYMRENPLFIGGNFDVFFKNFKLGITITDFLD